MGAQPRFYSNIWKTSSTVQLLICIISEHWLLPADSMSVMLCSFGSLFEPFQCILPSVFLKRKKKRRKITLASSVSGGFLGNFVGCVTGLSFCGWISILIFLRLKWADFWQSASQQRGKRHASRNVWNSLMILGCESHLCSSTIPTTRYVQYPKTQQHERRSFVSVDRNYGDVLGRDCHPIF